MAFDLELVHVMEGNRRHTPLVLLIGPIHIEVAQAYNRGGKLAQMAARPETAIGADIIAGFPTESEEMRSEEHTSELQSLMRISYAVFCLKKKNKKITKILTTTAQLSDCREY